MGLASRARLRYRHVAVPSPGPTAHFAVLLTLALASAGCDERAHAGSPDAPPDAAPPPPPPSAAAARPPPSASTAPDKDELRVLKLVFTSEVKNREPADVLKSAAPGQRVWAHLTVRNRGPAERTLTLVFKVNGKERSKVDLTVEPSWSFRTWGYTTLRAGDVGGLSVEVVDDSGARLITGGLPIRAPDEARPNKPVPLDE